MTTSSDSRPAGEDASVEAPSEWTPEQQIAHMLELCEAQMESALAESDQAVEVLVKAFTGLAMATRSLKDVAHDLPPEWREKIEQRIQERVGSLQEEMSSAVIAFQFYDKLTQRLGHVRYSLTSLAMFVCNRAQTSEREQWQKLFATLRRLYRTQEEREIFQLMVQGVSAEEARAQAEEHNPRTVEESGDIELF